LDYISIVGRFLGKPDVIDKASIINKVSKNSNHERFVVFSNIFYYSSLLIPGSCGLDKQADFFIE